jgi:hypothetical protein
MFLYVRKFSFELSVKLENVRQNVKFAQNKIRKLAANGKNN